MKCRMIFLAVLATTCLSLGWSSTVTAAPIILDDFSTFPGTWSNPPGQAAGTLQSNPTRTLILGGAGLNNVGDAIQINTGTQQFIVAHSPQSDFDVTLSYSTSGNFNSSNAVILQFQTLDLEMVITMTVNTTSGNLTANYTVPPQLSPFTFSLPFSSLAGSGNLANTTGISLTFNSDNRKNIDFILSGDAGGIILNGDLPEPGTLATLGLIGVVGGLAVRRRLRQGKVA
jgi:hypothetical protein